MCRAGGHSITGDEIVVFGIHSGVYSSGGGEWIETTTDYFCERHAPSESAWWREVGRQPANLAEPDDPAGHVNGSSAAEAK
jgi:hypothetical protein